MDRHFFFFSLSIFFQFKHWFKSNWTKKSGLFWNHPKWNSPTYNEMISVNCCFCPFVWCGRSSGVCVSDVMNIHRELHSMCLCNLFFILFFVHTDFSVPWWLFFTLRQTNAFFRFSSNKCFSYARVFFPFNSQAVCLTYSFLWSSTHLHLCEKCQAVIKLFFLSGDVCECVCVCACDFIQSQYVYIWILVCCSHFISSSSFSLALRSLVCLPFHYFYGRVFCRWSECFSGNLHRVTA